MIESRMLEYADVVSNPLLLVLSNALGNPSNVAYLLDAGQISNLRALLGKMAYLLPQLHPGVYHSVRKLPGKRQLGDLHFLLVKQVL